MINSIRTLSSISILSLLSEDVIININKGYTLHRVGIYSPELVEEIAHTFIPLTNLCAASPEASVCLYAALRTKKTIVSFGTIMATHPTALILPFYNTERATTLITQDIYRVLTQFNPGQIIQSNKSMIHFVNNQFHYQKTQTNLIVAKPRSNNIDNYSDIDRVPPTLAEKIRQQISNKKIDLQYLSEMELKLFLTAVFSTIDSSYSISDVEKSLNKFSQFIVGQSIFGLRYCSLDRSNTGSSEPCLVISTLFLRIPMDTRAKFLIYRLVPLPVVLNREIYIYTNLPNIIGINVLEETVIVWNGKRNEEECLFSELVQCRSVPIAFPLSKPSCMSQLIDINQSSTDMCEVRKLQDIQEDVMQIDDGIWLFYNTPHSQQCRVYSSSTDLTELISITEPTIINTSCNKTIACLDYQLPAAPCSQRQFTILPQPPPHIRSRSRLFPSLKTMSNTIVTAYNSQSKKSIHNMMQTFEEQKSFFKKIVDDTIAYVATTLSFILLLLFAYVIKFITCKLQQKIHCMELIIEDIITNEV